MCILDTDQTEPRVPVESLQTGIKNGEKYSVELTQSNGMQRTEKRAQAEIEGTETSKPSERIQEIQGKEEITKTKESYRHQRWSN
jgi:hypothetical protein